MTITASMQSSAVCRNHPARSPLMPPNCRSDIIRSHSRERVLFGTDYPMWGPSEELERFFRLELTEEENEKILCINAKNLLNE